MKLGIFTPVFGGLDLPAMLAIMHGSSFSGDGGAALRHLAYEYEHRYFASVAHPV